MGISDEEVIAEMGYNISDVDIDKIKSTLTLALIKFNLCFNQLLRNIICRG